MLIRVIYQLLMPDHHTVAKWKKCMPLSVSVPVNSHKLKKAATVISDIAIYTNDAE